MKKALLYEKSDDGSLICNLCSHYCHILPDSSGICCLRKNISGELYTMSWGKSSGFAVDPIEKKPFFHYKPGSKVLSFGTPGCNFSCQNCQNSSLSQSVRLKKITLEYSQEFTPEDIVLLASKNNVEGIAYTYSEPTIFFEYARDVIQSCRRNKVTKDLFHLFVSNGYFSRETFDVIRNENLLQGINIDLKFIDDKKYRSITGGKLQPVLDSIKRVNDLRETIVLEVINLIIPGKNDSNEDIEKLCEFMVSVSDEIPLHFNAFSPNYKFSSIPATPTETLTKARDLALDCGMKYVYTGNASMKSFQDTFCPECKTKLIQRNFYSISFNLLDSRKRCPKCNSLINIVL